MSHCSHFSLLFVPGAAGSQWVFVSIRIEHLQQFLGPSLTVLLCCSPLAEHKCLFASELQLGWGTSSVCCLEISHQGSHTAFLLLFLVLLNNFPHSFNALAADELLGGQENMLLSRTVILTRREMLSLLNKLWLQQMLRLPVQCRIGD